MRIIEATPRVTNGESLSYSLNGTPDKIFVKKFLNKDKGYDIFFFLKDDETAIVSDRTSSIVWHGKKGDFPGTDYVKYVYSTFDEEFYTPEDFSKLIRGVYKGSKARVKPINV